MDADKIDQILFGLIFLGSLVIFGGLFVIALGEPPHV